MIDQIFEYGNVNIDSLISKIFLAFSQRNVQYPMDEKEHTFPSYD